MIRATASGGDATGWMSGDTATGGDWVNNCVIARNISGTGVTGALNRSTTMAQIDRHIRVHDLRHTAASLALRKGVDSKVVQEMLDHANIAITLDIYGHLIAGMKEQAAEKIGEFLETGA